MPGFSDLEKYLRKQQSKEYQENKKSKYYSNKSTKCGCGNSKIYDADMCDECQEYQEAYVDR